ncbi:hypothetical protein H9K76_17585 [Diaphorobacter ruginosibacter]|jgi:hypothetical protein|uniref:Polymer-forming cytoskeletal protein n=1 Tax=Diaphorobacter ruginosibacter TaxID=1715720 RepID=A0A7G9RL70_9BURK|nr:hypothetical protein [Diaphorobacter ruginosibacter]MDR2336087.1 hypothetical protein [Burkholderiaceae bacterium]QNN56345.1 hypothetical protein H9K76_17585 [Diaphorobacter ruginosibacter]
MRILKGLLHDIAVTDQSTIEGQVLGNIVVTNGAELHLRGPCAGNLVVRRGGKAFIYAIVTGRIINEGGEIRMQGAMPGEIPT